MGLVSTYRVKLHEKLGAKNSLRAQLDQLETDLVKLEEKEDNTIKARALIQEVAQETQSQLEFQISALVTHALQSVFPDTYTFTPRFVQRNNRTVCDLLFTKDGEDFDPMSSSGGGVLDLASFALRVSFWAMNKTASVFIMDEPFKYVSVDMQEKVSQFLKILCEKLNIQIIMVSHLPNIIVAADNVIDLAAIKTKKSVKRLLPRRSQ